MSVCKNGSSSNSLANRLLKTLPAEHLALCVGANCFHCCVCIHGTSVRCKVSLRGGIVVCSQLGRPASRHALVDTIGIAPQPTPMDSHISLQVSKAITGFARYPHTRPRGLHSDRDGSLDIEEIWKHWGRHHGVSKHHMLQFISEHAFSSEVRRRFLLRSDNEGRTWVSVTQSLRRFTRRRRQRGGPDASRTLATATRGCDGDVLSISSGSSLEDDSTIGCQHPATGTVEVKSEPSGSATGSQDPAVSPTQLDYKDEPPATSPWNRQLHCKDEVPATIPLNRPLSDSADPVPGLTAPTAGPGLLDGFSFLFTETDNFGCPVVTGDEMSPLSDTISHTVPDPIPGTLEGITADSLLFTETDPLQPSEHDAPCAGQPVFAQYGSGVSHSFAGYRRTPIPSLVPQSHPSPVSAPSHDGNPIPTPPVPHWALKVTLDQDTRRLPLLCSGTPTYHDVITGVGILFNLAPSDPATRPALFYRDSDGDTCTLTNTTYHDALPLFYSNHIIRLSLAATHLAVACPSTIHSNTDTNPNTPPATRHQLTPWLVLRGTRLLLWNLTAKNTKVR